MVSPAGHLFPSKIIHMYHPVGAADILYSIQLILMQCDSIYIVSNRNKRLRSTKTLINFLYSSTLIQSYISVTFIFKGRIPSYLKAEYQLLETSTDCKSFRDSGRLKVVTPWSKLIIMSAAGTKSTSMSLFSSTNYNFIS